MFMLNWFKDMLGYLGLYKKNGKILFLGLDNAGKTTLLRRLKDDKMSQHDPTMYAHSEELVLGNVRFKAFDIGGHQAARKTWKNYFPTVDGIIYLVDAADSNRFEESKAELDSVLLTPELSKVPIIILGNKIDKKDAVSEEEIRMAMGLSVKNQFGSQGCCTGCCGANDSEEQFQDNYEDQQQQQYEPYQNERNFPGIEYEITGKLSKEEKALIFAGILTLELLYFECK